MKTALAVTGAVVIALAVIFGLIAWLASAMSDRGD
jgi:hypothetical protein